MLKVSQAILHVFDFEEGSAYLSDQPLDLESRATRITEQMKLAAAEALAALVSDDELSEDFILPEPFDPRAVEVVAAAVAGAVQE